MSNIDLQLKHVVLYTDGACIGNPGPGGYGVILKFGGQRKELSAGYRLTTSNRMEMRAAIAGLQALKTRCKVTIYSDSEILVMGITCGSARKARANGWRRGKAKKANSDLWDVFLKLCDRHVVEMVWIKAHAGHPENERADELASTAARQDNLLSDEAYESGNTEAANPDLFAQNEP